MLKKFTTLLCIGALAVAFVGCEQAENAAGDAATAVEGAAEAAGEGAKEAVAAGAEKVEEGAAAVKDAASGE